MRISTRKLVFLSFLMALSIILTRLFSIRVPIGGVEGIRIGFGALPIIFAGILFGPLPGGIVGALGDLLGYLINPMGAYMPHFTFSSFLTGYIPALLIKTIFKKRTDFTFLLIAIAIGQLLTSVLLVPYFISSLFGLAMEILIIPRLISQALIIPIYAILIKALLHFDLLRLEASKIN
ncbi:MAG: folate family ECF transporter S component [Bacillota bacterium]|nr:folate family ECF transporter S component [Bacillota bacterium]